MSLLLFPSLDVSESENYILILAIAEVTHQVCHDDKNDDRNQRSTFVSDNQPSTSRS